MAVGGNGRVGKGGMASLELGPGAVRQWSPNNLKARDSAWGHTHGLVSVTWRRTHWQTRRPWFAREFVLQTIVHGAASAANQCWLHLLAAKVPGTPAS